MISKNSKIGKMIDTNRVVLRCISCGRKRISDLKEPREICPICKSKDTIVIQENLIVLK